MGLNFGDIDNLTERDAADSRQLMATRMHNDHAIFTNSLRTAAQAVAAANAINKCRIALHDFPALQDRLHGFEMMCFHRADELEKKKLGEPRSKPTKKRRQRRARR